MKIEHVKGKNKGKVMLYALSTCVWCKKTRELLNELGVEYYYVYVDLLQGNYKEKAIGDVKKLNPRCSFPTIVINDKECIIGYKEDKIKEALGL